MNRRKLARFIIIYTTIGLVASYILISFFPGLFDGQRHQLEIKEVARPTIPNPLPVSGPVSYSQAVESAAPSVVNIYTTKVVTQRIVPFFDDPFLRQFFGDAFTQRKRRQNSLGSGVIISSGGYILTNNHVINGADEILVAFQDGTSTSATVVGIDPETDLAVLSTSFDDTPSITLGQSDALRVGDVVLAIGNPFGVGQTVTLGIVSATGRNQLGISTFENFIQTDAAINPGNSGGALINASGHLVGINTAIFSRSGGSQGIGFAIPVSIVKQVLEQILKHGHVVRGWLGIELQDITRELAESFGLDNTNGVIVAGVLRNGPADRAGITRGDIITSIGDTPIRDGRAALMVISQTKPDTKIDITLLRNGKTRSLQAKISHRPIPGK